MAEYDITVVLSYLASTQGELQMEIDDLSQSIAGTQQRIDTVEKRVALLHERIGLVNTPRGAPLLRPVPDPVPRMSWDTLVEEAVAEMPDDVTLDDLLTANQIERAERRFSDGFRARSGVDKYDIAAAVAAGVTGALLDYLVVAVPRDSSLTKALHSLSTSSDNWLAGIAKAPFDRVVGTGIDGMAPQTHRVQTFGHDPLLGWVYGTMDILRGSLTGVAKTGAMETIQVGEPAAESLPAALALQAMHLVSDVFTPAGLQLPGWTALLAIDQTLPGTRPSVAELSRWMYMMGYDTWHLPTMSVPILGVEAALRGYLGMRQLVDAEYRADIDLERSRFASRRVADLPRFELMSLIATGIMAAGNSGRFALSGANPLTLNYVIWLQFARQLLRKLNRPTPVSTLIDQAHRSRLMIDAAWERIGGELPEVTV